MEVSGITSELIFVMLANIEVREALIMHFPRATLALVERCFGTDDLECEFSLIVNGCGGYKLRLEMALGFLRNVDFLHFVRMMLGPQLGLSVPAFAKADYSHHNALVKGREKWNDGVLVQGSESFDAAALAAWCAKRTKGQNAIKMERGASVRLYHAMWFFWGVKRTLESVCGPWVVCEREWNRDCALYKTP